MSQDTHPDQLLAAAVAGDQGVLERLLFDRYDALRAFVAPRIPDQLRGLIDPEDILQQTFVEAFRDISRFRPGSPEAFSAWLKTIAEHRLLDAIKKQRRKKRGGEAKRVDAPAQSSSANLLAELQADGLTPSRMVARDEAAALLQVSIARLPQQYGEALRLRYLEGLSEEEAAERLGHSPDALRGLCHRAKKKLREAMGKSSLFYLDR
jgi:RNA polymerase sigma-70 factor (ECF subfamily)